MAVSSSMIDGPGPEDKQRRCPAVDPWTELTPPHPGLDLVLDPVLDPVLNDSMESCKNREFYRNKKWQMVLLMMSDDWQALPRWSEHMYPPKVTTPWTHTVIPVLLIKYPGWSCTLKTLQLVASQVLKKKIFFSSNKKFLKHTCRLFLPLYLSFLFLPVYSSFFLFLNSVGR